MTPVANAVLAVMLRQPPWSGDVAETPQQRRALYAPVAQTIADASTDTQEMAALATLAWHETRLARYVLEGRCKDGPASAQCDQGHARGPWQVWPWCKDAYRYADGSAESRRAEARCALQMLGWGRKMCADKGVAPGWHSAYAGYRSLRCEELDAPKRLETHRRIARELTTEIAVRKGRPS